MIKKVSLILIVAFTSIAPFAQAAFVYNPNFYGDTVVQYTSAKIYVSNFPTGNCDGSDLHFDLNENSGMALYQTYLTLRANGDTISRIGYNWNAAQEKCYIYHITY